MTGGASALAGFPQGGGHGVAHVAHGENHFVQGNGAGYARKRELGRADRLGDAAHVAVDAGHLHQPAHGIAHQPSVFISAKAQACAAASGVPP